MAILRIAAAACFVGGVGLVLAPAYAEPSANGSLLLAQAAMPDQQKLESFAAATVRVLQIQQQAEVDLQVNEDPNAAPDIHNQAQAQMVRAIAEEGLTVDEYNTIAQLTEQNPEVGAIVRQLVQEQLDG